MPNPMTGAIQSSSTRALANIDRHEEAKATMANFRSAYAKVPESRMLFNNKARDVLAVAEEMMNELLPVSWTRSPTPTTWTWSWSWWTARASGRTMPRRRLKKDPRRCLGRSRGGLGTKIHAVTNQDGLPFRYELTPGQVHDAPPCKTLLDNLQPGQHVLADKA